MNEIRGMYDIWELQPGSARRYRNLVSGKEMSRRQYIRAVKNGTIAKYPNGALTSKETYRTFPNTGSRHKIISAPAKQVSSVRELAISGKRPGALPAKTSISIRVIGTVGTERIGLQTRMWNSVSSCMQDLQDLLRGYQTTSVAASGSARAAIDRFESEKVEVVYRSVD